MTLPYCQGKLTDMTTKVAQRDWARRLHDLLPMDGADTDEVLDTLEDLAYVVRWGKFNVRALMQTAIAEGATYQDVADALGISRQSAWEALHPRGSAEVATSLDQLKLF